ncbi:MAG: nucleotide-binding protein [Gammaproteobacteria bacterium]|nr:nucleotide-binding protein [Gammaproteobacteria bacterium]
MFTKTRAIEKINSLIEQIVNLQNIERGSAQFNKWIRDVQVALEHIFGKDSRHIKDFNDIDYSLMAFTFDTPDYKFQEKYVRGLEDAKHVLVSMIEEIDEYWDDHSAENILRNEKSTPSLETRKIFIIHGHDSGTKETVARFITKLGLEPIILHEQASLGRTIIEKFESYSDVGFAIALITPDDIGSSTKDLDNQRKRARQNVIFEFGYFIGKIGRNRVAGLVKGEVEVPSDYSGVLYIPFDESGSWRFNLIKELKTVGYDVDANKAI